MKQRADEQRVEDKEFMRLVHLLPCCARNIEGHRCHGPIEAHHAGSYVRGLNPHGKGKKADDTTCIPLCWWAHHALETMAANGDFYHWPGQRLRDWQDEMIVATRAAVERLRQDPQPMSEAELPW